MHILLYIVIDLLWYYLIGSAEKWKKRFFAIHAFLSNYRDVLLCIYDFIVRV